MKNSKVFLIMICLLFLSSGINAEIESLKGKAGDCVNLRQTCNNCTFVNLTKIQYPNQTIYNLNKQMTKLINDYNYTFCGTKDIGTYLISTCGDVDGYLPCYSPPDYPLYITSSGENSTNNLVFIIFIIVIIYLIAFVGFFFKNEIITLFGGMFMIGLAIYLVNNGIIVYRDWITNYFAYVTLGIGVFFSILAGMSLFEEL